MPRKIDRRKFLQVSAGVALSGVALGSGIKLPGVKSNTKPSAPRRVLTKEIRLGPAELLAGKHPGLTVSRGGVNLARGRTAGYYLSPALKSDLPFHCVGLFWSGAYPDGTKVSFWTRTSADGRNWGPWAAVQVEMPPGPLAEYDAYGSLISGERASYVQFLGELRGSKKEPRLDGVGLVLLNPYDGPELDMACSPGDREVTNKAFAAEAGPRHGTGVLPAATFPKPITFSRENWGADESLRFAGGEEVWPRAHVPTKKLVVHHTVTSNSYASVDEAKALVRAIYTYHAQTLGWGDIGYNCLIDRFGNSYEGRRGRDGPGFDGPAGREILSEDIVAGHASSYNYGSSGVALLGTFCSPGECSGASPTAAMISRLTEVLTWECQRHGIDPQADSDFLRSDDIWHRNLPNLVGHRDVFGTTCPGGNVYALLPQLRSDVAARLANPTSPTVTMTAAPPQASVSDGTAQYAWSGGGGSPPLEYSYYLEGWIQMGEGLRYLSGYTDQRSPAWSPWTSDTTAHLNFTSQGHYAFHVRVRDAGGGIGTFEDNRTFLGNTPYGGGLAVWRPSEGSWYVLGRPRVQWGLPGDIPVPGDYDGNGETDLAVWRPSSGTWYIPGRSPIQWGLPGDIPVPGDYDGNGKTDIAVWRPSNGIWYVRGRPRVQWGLPGDIPVPGGYTGAGKTDMAVWRPSTGTWHILGDPPVQWGLPGDVPVPGDYYGERKASPAVWRPGTGTWHVLNRLPVQWGASGDIPVPGDFGGGKTQMVVWRPSTGTWHIRGQPSVLWGQSGDIPVTGVARDVPVPGDYNGDGRTDMAIWRPANGTWYVLGRSSVEWGQPGDVPVPGDYTGAGKTDMAVWRPSNGSWYVFGQPRVQWGEPGDIPVAGDYTGDGKTDMAVWRPSNGTWYVFNKPRVQWGEPGDIPVPGDYTGDGKTDRVVWRPSNGTWYVFGQPRVEWGLSGDIPVPGDYTGDGKTDTAVWRTSTGTWHIPGQAPVKWGLPSIPAR